MAYPGSNYYNGCNKPISVWVSCGEKKHKKRCHKPHPKPYPCPPPVQPNICNCSTSTADPTGYFALFNQSVGFLQQPATNPQRQAFFVTIPPGGTQTPFQIQLQSVTTSLNNNGLNLPPSLLSQALVQNMIQLLNIIGAAGVAGTVIPATSFTQLVQTLQFALCVAQFPYRERLRVLPQLNAQIQLALTAVQQIPLAPATIATITNILTLLSQIVNTPDRCY